MLSGTLAGVEMGLAAAGVPHRKGGIQAALDYLAKAENSETRVRPANSRARSEPPMRDAPPTAHIRGEPDAQG